MFSYINSFALLHLHTIFWKTFPFIENRPFKYKMRFANEKWHVLSSKYSSSLSMLGDTSCNVL